MIEVVAPGPLALVQDLGRAGYLHLGVGRSGAADRSAFRLANRLVGNPEGAAGIEFTVGGFHLLVRDAATLAFTGAPCPVTGGRALDWNAAVSVSAGTELKVGPPELGVRSYLAIRGGLAVEQVLGSSSTDTLSGLGPPPIRAGTCLDVGDMAVSDPGDPAVDLMMWAPRSSTSRRALEIVPGPRLEWFEDSAWSQLVSTTWRVNSTSDRVGIRLDGPALVRRRGDELPSEPTVPGAVQVPPDGRPIVLGPDAPVTGGYPVIGVLTAAARDRLAQARPSDELSFAARSVLWA